jgi:hypothetical protein
MKKLLFALVLVGTTGASGAWAQLKTGPAPSGEPTVIAQCVIHANFAETTRLRVSEARRAVDGSIIAVCSNGERFRVFNVAGVGDVAWKFAGPLPPPELEVDPQRSSR